MSLKICFLSFAHVFYDTRILHKECRSLAEAGFEVVHIAPDQDPNHNHTIHGVQIELYTQRSGLLGRLIKFIDLYLRAIHLDADCYHCNEIESWIVGLLIKLFHQDKRIIFDVHEHYPSRFDEPHIPKGLGLIGKPIIHLLFRVLPKWTDYIIFAKRSVVSDFRGIKDKHDFIFNYGPLWLSSRLSKDVAPIIRQETGKGNKVAIHIGGFSRARGWPQLLKSLTMMKYCHLEIFCFGYVHEGEDELMADAQNLGVAHRIHLKQPIPYEQMFDYLLCADIGLMLYQPGIQNHVFAFPMKMYDYMLAGLPVIGPDFAIEVEPVVRQEKCGLLVNTADSRQIAESLDWLCEYSDLAKEMGKRGKQAIIDRYNWENEAKKLIEIYTKFNAPYIG